MCCKRTTASVVAIISFILIGTLAGCARREGVERLAVMPVENLSSDSQLDWLSRAVAAAVVYDLAGSKNVYARQVDSLSAAQAMQASRLVEGYFVARNGRVGIHAAVEDLTTTKAAETFEIEGAKATGFLPLANQLAQRLNSEVRGFSTKSEAAFRSYGEALAARDPRAAEQALQAAKGADPGFVEAYLDEAKLLSETGDRDGARRAVEAAERARLDAIDRANLQYVAATASGDTNGRMKALEAAAASTPANASVFRELGQIRFARREFPQAVMEYRAAARLNPDEPEGWNELGYALAWARDLSGAREALAQYGKLAPDDVNVLDSQGEVSYMLGDFKAASDLFERAAARNPAEWVKAAEARMMLGDPRGADGFFARHLGPAGVKGGGAEVQMAEWEYLTGRKGVGVARMQKVAKDSSGALQAVALNQLSIWRLEEGEAKDLASFEAGAHSKMADAFALMFAKKYQEASPLLQGLYNETNPSNDWQVRTMLARAYVNTGAKEKAAALVHPYPLPLSGGDALFSGVVFGWYLDVRKQVK